MENRLTLAQTKEEVIRELKRGKMSRKQVAVNQVAKVADPLLTPISPY